MLCTVKGIGVKVASCALLFGFARLDEILADPINVALDEVGFPQTQHIAAHQSGKRGDGKNGDCPWSQVFLWFRVRGRYKSIKQKNLTLIQFGVILKYF